jgi:hypothetical protein
MAITVENERFCPGIITDEIHLPSAPIPFSVPAVIYVIESGLGKESSSNVLPCERGIDNSGAQAEAVEVQIHGGFCQAMRWQECDGPSGMRLALIGAWQARDVRETSPTDSNVGADKFLCGKLQSTLPQPIPLGEGSSVWVIRDYGLPESNLGEIFDLVDPKLMGYWGLGIYGLWESRL